MSDDNPVGKKIAIGRGVNAIGPEFDHLTPGSEHTIVEPPNDHYKEHEPNGRRGYWVWGKTEPVLVLFQEMKIRLD